MYYILKKQKESFLHTYTLMNKLVHVISVGFILNLVQTWQKWKKLQMIKKIFFLL